MGNSNSTFSLYCIYHNFIHLLWRSFFTVSCWCSSYFWNWIRRSNIQHHGFSCPLSSIHLLYNDLIDWLWTRYIHRLFGYRSEYINFLCIFLWWHTHAKNRALGNWWWNWDGRIGFNPRWEGWIVKISISCSQKGLINLSKVWWFIISISSVQK